MKCCNCDRKATTMVEGTYYCKKCSEVDMTEFDKPISRMVYLEKKPNIWKEIIEWIRRI